MEGGSSGMRGDRGAGQRAPGNERRAACPARRAERSARHESWVRLLSYRAQAGADPRAIGLAGTMRNNVRILTSALSLTAAVVLVGCSADTPTADPIVGGGNGATTEPAPESPTPGETETGELDPVTAAALAAIDLAEAETGGVAFELDDEDDDSAWKVDVAVGGDEIEVTVDWVGTQITATRPDGSVDSDDRRKLDHATVTIQEAIRIAAAEATGNVTDVDLSTEGGVIVWDIEFDDGPADWEIHVDAQSGEIVKAERD